MPRLTSVAVPCREPGFSPGASSLPLNCFSLKSREIRLACGGFGVTFLKGEKMSGFEKSREKPFGSVIISKHVYFKKIVENNIKEVHFI